jgi:hypothetical protein
MKKIINTLPNLSDVEVGGERLSNIMVNFYPFHGSARNRYNHTYLDKEDMISTFAELLESYDYEKVFGYMQDIVAKYEILEVTRFHRKQETIEIYDWEGGRKRNSLLVKIFLNTVFKGEYLDGEFYFKIKNPDEYNYTHFMEQNGINSKGEKTIDEFDLILKYFDLEVYEEIEIREEYYIIKNYLVDYLIYKVLKNVFGSKENKYIKRDTENLQKLKQIIMSNKNL